MNKTELGLPILQERWSEQLNHSAEYHERNNERSKHDISGAKHPYNSKGMKKIRPGLHILYPRPHIRECFVSGFWIRDEKLLLYP